MCLNYGPGCQEANSRRGSEKTFALCDECENMFFGDFIMRQLRYGCTINLLVFESLDGIAGGPEKGNSKTGAENLMRNLFVSGLAIGAYA